ncbi:hypothetical protein D3C81_1227160 [compost metagenome]
MQRGTMKKPGSKVSTGELATFRLKRVGSESASCGVGLASADLATDVGLDGEESPKGAITRHPSGQSQATRAPSIAASRPATTNPGIPSTMVPLLSQTGQGVVTSPSRSTRRPPTRKLPMLARQVAPVVVRSPSSAWPLPFILMRLISRS